MKKSLLKVAHDMAKDLHEVGAIDNATMREFDATCLPRVHELSPNAIKRLRRREKVSQSVFAKYLNVSLSTVRQWEQGVKHPHGGVLKLLNLVVAKGLRVLTWTNNCSKAS